LFPNVCTLSTKLTIISDLPNTVFTTAQSGISISPHNYLLGDPSRVTSHTVHIDKTGDVPAPEIYGGEVATCAVDLVRLVPRPNSRKHIANWTTDIAERRFEPVPGDGISNEVAAGVCWWRHRVIVASSKKHAAKRP
jgi:hypothetical protein